MPFLGSLLLRVANGSQLNFEFLAIIANVANCHINNWQPLGFGVFDTEN